MREFHHAADEGLRSTNTILYPKCAAKQSGFSLDEHLTVYAREASAARVAQFKPPYRPNGIPGPIRGTAPQAPLPNKNGVKLDTLA